MRTLFYFFFILVSLHADAQQSADLIERSYTGVSQQESILAAKKDIQDQAINKISEEIIIELMGQENFTKRKSLIQQKIIKQSAKYIPFSKPSEPETTTGGATKMTMMMKVSISNLRTLLKSQGFLNENELAPIILPLVTYSDKVQMKNFRWWIPLDRKDKGFLVTESRLLEKALQNSFQKSDFFLIKPIDGNLHLQVPLALQNEHLTAEDFIILGQLFHAPVVINGQVNFSKNSDTPDRYRIDAHFAAIQVANGRTIADVSRHYDTEVGLFEVSIDKKLKEVSEGLTNDLALQVYEVWQKGSLGSSVLKMTIKGYVPIKDQEQFKDKVRSSIPQIRNLRERLISADSIVFEFESHLSPKEIAKFFSVFDLNGRTVSATSTSDDELVLQIKRPL